jgi:hypothetical protein
MPRRKLSPKFSQLCGKLSPKCSAENFLQNTRSSILVKVCSMRYTSGTFSTKLSDAHFQPNHQTHIFNKIVRRTFSTKSSDAHFQQNHQTHIFNQIIRRTFSTKLSDAHFQRTEYLSDMLGGRAQWSCSVVMLSGHAQWHARWSCSVGVLSGHAQWSCAVACLVGVLPAT